MDTNWDIGIAFMKNVSVIIPVYNSEACLKKSIERALSQGLYLKEVIVVNDGSNDATADVAKDYGSQIVYIEQNNLGQGAARNAGLKVATGRFIAFLDSDDYWKPNFLRPCVEFLLSHEKAIAVSVGLIIRMLDGSEVVQPKQFCNPGKTKKESFMIDDFFDFWARFDDVRTGSNVIRHSIIKKAGLQREDLRISQDLEYWGYLATFGKWGFIPESLWIGNSRQATCKQGWLAKYRKRRNLCPDVEQWGTHIEPRLRSYEREGFEKIRGRVALNYAHNKILAGARKSAYEVVKKYGSTMPPCLMSSIIRSAAWFGQPAWFTACNIICLKDWIKAYRIWLGR